MAAKKTTIANVVNTILASMFGFDFPAGIDGGGAGSKNDTVVPSSTTAGTGSDTGAMYAQLIKLVSGAVENTADML